MTPVNTIDGGAPALEPSAPQSLTAPVGMAQPADVSAVMTQLDRLEAEAKALRQEALNAQTSIEQLQLVESGRTYPAVEFAFPVNFGAQGAMLGIGALFFLGVLWWYTSRRTPKRRTTEHTEFVDSSYFSKQDHAQFKEKIHKRHSREPAARVNEFFPSEQFGPDPVPQADSVLDSTFVQEEISASFESVWGQPTDTLKLEAGYAAKLARQSEVFDPDVAAQEVERVRKFLANKRADRTKHTDHESTLRQGSYHTDDEDESHLGHDIFADYQPEGESGALTGHLKPVTVKPDAATPPVAEKFEVNLPTTQDDSDEAQQSRLLALELWESGGHAIKSDPKFLLNLVGPDWKLSMDDLDYGGADPFDLKTAELGTDETVKALLTTATKEDTADKHADEQADADDTASDAEVQLALANEFMDLGLYQGARKLAAEVVESANAHFRAQAQVLISKLDKLELSLHQDS
jgi:FimV-like protein